MGGREITEQYSDASDETDKALLARIGAADERALAELYARYSAVILSFAMTRVSDRGVAEEVAADVWMACWRSARAFRRESRVLTWLLGITKRQIYAHTRRKSLPLVPIEESMHEIFADNADPADLVASTAHTHLILTALRSLPAELEEVVRLAWIQELSYERIAGLIGIPAGTVKSRVSRARRLLRKDLRRQDV